MLDRCPWVGEAEIYQRYHDTEWGVPVTNGRALWEKLILDGFQAGLSWLTILKKRDNYRKAFAGFDCATVANYSAQDINRLLLDPGIVRNRLKIESAIKNAQAAIKIQEEFGSLDNYLWKFVDGIPQMNEWKSIAELPAKTATSEKMSKDLKKRGFNFVGPTICYAFMQAIGMVNDHTTDCFRHKEVRSGD